MPPLNDETEVFIVRLWQERLEDKHAEPLLRGVVEHIATQQRRYVDDLDEITKYIRDILKLVGWEEENRWRETYTLNACWGDWHFSTTQPSLNGTIECEGRLPNGDRSTLQWTLEDQGDSILWTERGGRWHMVLRKICEHVWLANRGSSPYLVIYKNP